MADHQASLVSLMQQLRSQLHETPTLDPAVAAELHELAREIEAALPGASNQPATDSTPDLPLTDRVRQAALDFEAAHPTLSQTVGNIADSLAKIGI